MSNLVKQMFALEEDATPVLEDTTSETELAEYDDASDVGNEVDELATAISQCTDAVEGLESFAEVIEGMLEEGMSPQTAAMVQTSVKFLGASIGLEMDDVVPGLEEFSDKTGKKHYTKHILHKIKLKLGVIWKHIIQFINSWKMKVVGFATKLRDSAGGLGKKAQAEIDAIAKTPDLKFVPVKINGTMYRNLSMKGSINNIAGGLGDLANRIRTLQPTDAMDAAIVEYVEALDKLDFTSKETLVASYTDPKFVAAVSFDKFVQIATDSAKGGLITPVNDKRFISPDITYRLEKQVYLGEHQLVYCLKQNPDKMLRGLVITWADAERNIKFEPEYEATSLSAGTAQSILKAVVEVTGAIQASRVDYMKRIKSIDTLLKVSNKFIKELDAHKLDLVNDEAYKLVRSYVSGVAALTSVMVEPALTLERQAMDSAKAAYGYVSLSSKMAKVAEPKTDAE